MNNIQRAVARAIYRSEPENWFEMTDNAITTFLKEATKKGWCMRRDVPTDEMLEAAAGAENERRTVTPVTYARVLRGHHAMQKVAPEFKWKDD